jgi:hypothetical protein
VKRRLCAIGLLLAGLVPASQAADPDADLLEFLGSVDSEGPGWDEYLAQTDVDQVATAPPAGDQSGQVKNQ